MLLTTTLYNRGWLFRDFYLFWRGGDPAYFVAQIPSPANPHYSQEVLERNRCTMSPARFLMMHEGDFEGPNGMVH